MKYISKIGVMIVASGILAATSCSDFSDYNTVVEDTNVMAGKTLWQNISENENLKNFSALVKKAGFVDNLNNPRFYTVFAPLDGTYDAESLMKADSATILKEFVKQHIVEYNHPVSGIVDENLISLNAKSHHFTNDTFGESSINTANIPASNGVIHLLNASDIYYNSIYDYVRKVEGCDLLKKYIQRYDVQYIDEANSIIGPIVNGEQTYEHIEYATKNDVINNILEAELDNEDSIYTMLFPQDKAWEASYARISPNYKFLSKVAYMNLEGISSTTEAASITATTGTKTQIIGAPEYLQDSLTTQSMVRNLVFSDGYPQNRCLIAGGGSATDSLVTSRLVHLPDPVSVNSHTVASHKMSNGYVRLVDSIPFNSWDTFEPVIRTYNSSRNNSVWRALKCNPTEAAVTKKSLANRDSLFSLVPKFIYDRIMGDKSEDEDNFKYTVSSNITATSAKPEFNFMLRNVLSTTYHIYVVTVPEQIDDSLANVKPYYLNFYLNYTDENNLQVKKLLPLSPNADPSWGPVSEPGSSKSKPDNIVTVGGRVNVIDLGEFTFPISYYGLEAYPNIMMCHTQSYATSSNRAKYERYLRVAGIFLFPVEADTYFKNK